VLWEIVIPGLDAGLWDTFRITIGWTWTYLVVAELVAARDGLGRRIMEAAAVIWRRIPLFWDFVYRFPGSGDGLYFKFLYAPSLAWTKEN